MRPRTRRRWLATVLLLALLPVALKGLMYLRAKRLVDGFITELEERARIDYRGLETHLSGAITVNEVRVEPRELGVPLEIARVRLATDDLWFLLDPRPLLGDPTASRPEQMRLQAVGIGLPLDERLIDAWQAHRAQGAGNDGCEEISFDPAMLRALGMRRLEADLEGAYRFDRAGERLTLQTSIDIHDVERVQLSLELAGIVPEDLELGRATRARLAAAEVSLEVRPEFGRRYLAHCAAERQQDPEAYASRMIARTHEDLAAAGIEPGPALQQALDDFNRRWGRLRLRLDPPEPLALAQLLTIDPGRLVRTLGLTLTVNGRQVDPLEVRILPRGVATLLPGLDREAEQAPEAGTPRRYLLRHRFVPASTASLEALVGRRVRITQQGHPVREGILVDIVGGEALVEQREPGGKVVAYVPLREIRAVEVEQVERIPQP